MRESLSKFICDNCKLELIAENVPNGWVRLLSTHNGKNYHHGNPPEIWTPNKGMDLPKNAYFCSPECMTELILERAKNLVDLAKLGRR